MPTTRTLTHWGTYDVETRAGEVVSVAALEDDPDPSAIGQSLAGTLSDATRITQPMVRKGYLEDGPSSRAGRGAEPFVPVSWEVATKLVADEIDRIRSTFGNEALYGGSYGWASAGRFHHAQSQIHRFFNCIGGCTRSLNTYSFAAAEVILPHVIGRERSIITAPTTWPSIIKHSELVVAFGGLPVKNGQITSGGIRKHRQRSYIEQAHQAGVEFVSISPLRHDTIDTVNATWLCPRPNTDVALMLGLSHTLVTESLYSRSFVQTHCVGFDRFADYLLGKTDGQPKSADWAANICQIDAHEITTLARRMASKRTMISTSWSLTRQDHGEQPYWMTVNLAALLGQIGLPGGGFGFGYSAENKVGEPATEYRLAAMPQGQNAIRTTIPVSRIADMLLGPGSPYTYNGQDRHYPEIKLVYWAGGNPFHHHQDLNRLLQAWRQPDTTICHEISWNTTAKCCDIVLPCTSPLERNDLGGRSGESVLLAMHQVCAPHAEARNDFDIFAAIAGELGAGHAFTLGLDEMGWLQKLYNETAEATADSNIKLPDFETFWRDVEFHYPEAEPEFVRFERFREQPEASPLTTVSGKVELFSDTIAGFQYEDCPGHPAWLEPYEWLGSNIAADYPLHLISNQPGSRLHSQLDHGVTSLSTKIDGREPVAMHPDDATRRDLQDGDIVRVFNDRGQLLAVVQTTEDLRPGVVQMVTGAWWDPEEMPRIGEVVAPGSLCKHGNVNVLTRDKGTSSLAQGPTAMSCLIEVERYEGPIPAVTAHQPPEILEPR